MSECIAPPIDLGEHTKEKSIPKVLVEEFRKEINDLLDDLTLTPKNEKTLLICGSNNVGKSTLARKFVNDPLPDRCSPTLSTRYYYGIRKATPEEREKDPQSEESRVSNIWEASSGPLFMVFLECIEVGPELSVVLMVDLSEPTKIWESILPVLKGVQSYISKVRKDAKELKEASIARIVVDDHPEMHQVRPFDAPLIIIGGKYDLFEKFSPEAKRIICTCLRFIAHYYCAYLIFYSDHNPSLVKSLRDVLNQYAYNVKSSNFIVPVFDHNSPLHIPPGMDSFKEIMSQKPISTIEECHTLLNSYYEQEKVWGNFSDLLKDEANFKESSIDKARKLREENLMERLKEKEESFLGTQNEFEYDESDSEIYDTASDSSEQSK